MAQQALTPSHSAVDPDPDRAYPVEWEGLGVTLHAMLEELQRLHPEIDPEALVCIDHNLDEVVAHLPVDRLRPLVSGVGFTSDLSLYWQTSAGHVCKVHEVLLGSDADVRDYSHHAALFKRGQRIVIWRPAMPHVARLYEEVIELVGCEKWSLEYIPVLHYFPPITSV